MGRRPIRSDSAPAIGETIIGVAKNGSSRTPVEIGEVPARELELLRDQECRGEGGPGHEECRQVAGSEGRGAEEAHRHHRFGHPLFPAEKAEKERTTREERPDDLRARQSDVVRTDQCPHQTEDAAAY